MKDKLLPLIKLGNNIRHLREQKRLSQEQLALNSNLDRTYVGGVERGERNISVLNLCRIAKSLDIMPMQLLAGVYLDGINQ